jgi:DNA modification methylase
MRTGYSSSSDVRGRPVDSSLIELVPINTLRPHSNNARTHSRKQIRQISESIKQFGNISPIIVGDDGEIFAGHARFEANKLLHKTHVPAIRISHLSKAEVRAYMLADNRLAANAGWDREQLAIEFEELQAVLPEIGINLDITGFEPTEVDLLLADMASPKTDRADEVPAVSSRAVTRCGDLWILGRHQILCGDARDAANFRRLMEGKRAAAVFCDPPYNLRVRSIGGRGRIRHREFAFASGEMGSAEFRKFLATTLRNAVACSADGAIHFVCMDWRHVGDLIEIGPSAYGEMLNIVVWNKSNAGQGSFYRSKHELICVFRVGPSRHRNNIELGRHGRNRSNVWDYAGVNTFGRDRYEQLAMHPTVKPIAMVADALLDCTARGDMVLDPFGGSGTLVLAAEKTGRIARVMEIDPIYVDLSVMRWQSATNLEGILASDGRSFEAVARAHAGNELDRTPSRSADADSESRAIDFGSRRAKRSKRGHHA